MREISLTMILVLAGCAKPVALYCDEDKPCTNPDFPFCDLSGSYEASEGIGNRCIPDPFLSDSGPVVDSGTDAMLDAAQDAGVRERVVEVAVGSRHSCALTNEGRVRCWGIATALGYAASEAIGDDELPLEGQDVPLPEPAKAIEAGALHTCAITISDRLICWGENGDGQLGIAQAGNNTPPTHYTDVGGAVVDVAMIYSLTCALLDNGAVRCWGNPQLGQLGYGFDPAENIGDDEAPATFPPLSFPGVPTEIDCGSSGCCALLSAGELSCWGRIYAEMTGNDDDIVGDDETPASVGVINIGAKAVEMEWGSTQGCIRTAAGEVRCWGHNSYGEVGIAKDADIDPANVVIGDDPLEVPLEVASIGGSAVQLFAGHERSCAVLASGEARCWGRASRLGSQTDEDFGDDESPSAAPMLDLGISIEQVSSGQLFHSCAVDAAGSVRCWGSSNQNGVLGYGNVEPLGDDEPAGSGGPVQIFPDLD